MFEHQNYTSTGNSASNFSHEGEKKKSEVCLSLRNLFAAQEAAKTKYTIKAIALVQGCLHATGWG